MNREIDVIKTIQEYAGMIRVGFTALALGGVGGAVLPDLQKAITDTKPSIAYADDELLKPAIFHGPDGREFTVAPFEKAGRAYIFTGESGLQVNNGPDDISRGVIYGGKTKLIVVANSSDMNVRVSALNCGEGLFIDVIDQVDGKGYMQLAPNAMDILTTEMTRIPEQERREYSEIGLIVVRDSALNSVFDLIGGSIDRGIRSEPQGCGTVPSESAPSVPSAPAIAACTGALQITDVRGVPVMGVDGGVKSHITGSFDLADHFPFISNLPGLSGTGNPLRNVLGDPGALLADRDLVARTEPGNLGFWDSQVAAGMAEYLQRGVNFFELQTPQPELRLSLPKHVIVRIDAEEANVSMISASGDRNVRLNLCQAGTTDNGFPRAHQTLFIRSPYEQASTLVISNPTAPGTEVQIFGMNVKNPTAFASANAFLQGVQVRQANPDVSRYLVETFNINDMTLGAADSEGPGLPFQAIEKNY